MAENIRAQIPRRVQDLIAEGSLTAGEVVKLKPSAQVSVSREDVEKNAVLVGAVIDAFPENIPSAFFLADSLL